MLCCCLEYSLICSLFVFVLLVAGKRLSSLLRKYPIMPSDAVFAMMVQRGASSLVVRSSGGTTEAGAEETSKVVDLDLDVTGDGPDVDKEVSGVVTRDKAKKRLHKDGAPPRSHHHKKAKGAVLPSGGEPLKTAMDRSAEVESLLGMSSSSKKEFLKDFKGHLDQVLM